MKKILIILVIIIVIASALFVGMRLFRQSGGRNNNAPQNKTVTTLPVRDLGDCTVTGFTKDTQAYNQVQGVDANFLSLDVYVPKTKGICDTKYPLMVYVHGGGWQNGDKAGQIKSKSDYFTNHGYVFVSVNYRLTPAVFYPTHNQDVATAIKWLSDNAAKYSARNTNMTIMGHSAGGGIIAALATDEKYLNGVSLPLNTLKCAVGLDGAGYDISQKGDQEMFYTAFGTEPSIWREASPINHVSANKGIPSFFLVTRNQAQKQTIDKSFQQKLDEVGIFSVHLISKLSHNAINAAVGDPQDTIITPALQEFLNTKCK